MRYCLAFDIAKGKSVAGLFGDDGSVRVLIRPFTVEHRRNALNKLWDDIPPSIRSEMTVIMESTSLYHQTLFQFFVGRGIDPILLNPLISKQQKDTLRKTKTDTIDCAHLARLYFENKHNKQSRHSGLHCEMQEISRYIAYQTKTLTNRKNRYRQLLGKTFPLLETIWDHPFFFSETALRFVIRFPHAAMIAKTRMDALANQLYRTHGRHRSQYRKMAMKIKEAAKDSLYAVSPESVVCDEVRESAALILKLIGQREHWKKRLIGLGKKTKQFPILHSIFGVGEWLASFLTAELKDVTRFKGHKQLTAACGLDPTIVQSGRSVNVHGPISKRGNRRARYALFVTASTIITLASKSRPDNPFLIYYQKKRSEGKHHYAALTACATKLLRVIYTLCVNDTQYKHSV